MFSMPLLFPSRRTVRPASFALLAFSAGVLGLCAPHSARAVNIFFQPANSAWQTGANWNTVEAGGGVAGLPGASDLAIVRGNKTANFTAATGDQTVLNILIGGASSNGTLNISGDDTLRATTSGLGFGFGNGTTGGGSGAVVNQTGATIDVDGDMALAWNSNPNNSGNIAIANYNHSGGALTVGGNLYLARMMELLSRQNKQLTATYNISGPATVDIDGGLFIGQNGITGAASFANGTLAVTGSQATIAADGFTQATSNTTLRFVMDGGGVTSLNVDGPVTVGGTLQINLSGLPAQYAGNILLIDNDGLDAISGVFSSIAGIGGTIWDGMEFMFGLNRFQLSYTYDAATRVNGFGNDLALINMVPEPGTFVLFGLGGLGLVLAAWRRSRLAKIC